MAKILIIHGEDNTPESNWYMWLKGVLIGQGHQVWLPDLPDADKPNAKTYNKFLLSNPNFVYDDNTLLVGHSSSKVDVSQHYPRFLRLLNHWILRWNNCSRGYKLTR